MRPPSLGTRMDSVDDSKASAPADVVTADLPVDLAQVEGTLRVVAREAVRVRAIRLDDTERLQAFHNHLSADSILFRFFRNLPALPRADAERFSHLDYRDRMALVAIAPIAPVAPPLSGVSVETAPASTDSGAILGVVRHERIGPALAEVAFVVEHHWQVHGIATALLYRIAAYARAQGITQFLAITMSTNYRMLEVLRHAGYPLSVHTRDIEAHVTLDISRPATGEPAADAPVPSSLR